MAAGVKENIAGSTVFRGRGLTVAGAPVFCVAFRASGGVYFSGARCREGGKIGGQCPPYVFGIGIDHLAVVNRYFLGKGLL